MIFLGLVLLIVGLIVSYLVPEPLVARLGQLCAAIGAVLLLVGVVLLALDGGHHLHAVLRL
jgi:hypothetical protein